MIPACHTCGKSVQTARWFECRIIDGVYQTECDNCWLDRHPNYRGVFDD